MQSGMVKARCTIPSLRVKKKMYVVDPCISSNSSLQRISFGTVTHNCINMAIHVLQTWSKSGGPSIRTVYEPLYFS